ncbi:hypothetical protein EHQ68_02140 [Leptospira congkakensis]|uniref:Glycosyltransferase RgtA/B/C/D-like domain-containing protein n=1 Tax=Leptospira congkakensis TaxID=2484932 RepID=A0A4Z1ACA4_9LEPT|nr:hypothetical protein [Leptospira congkakensis]TGL90256.1 hypothetical protein EHQ69_09900 [Leptospira congkakensis]TGL91263.1 hypothetical protein EHQ68_02140 [Leptospira congkakensis]TGL98315.1 hypothetical protein EHQ70_01725 [Leptospira congkakensis]
MKNKIQNTKPLVYLLIFGVFFIGVQVFISAKTSFISDSLAKSIQIESAKKFQDSILYPAESIDPEKSMHPVLFVIPNQGKLKSVFSEAFAETYAKLFFFLPIQWIMFTNVIFLLLSAYCLYKIGKVPVEISLLIFISSVVFSQVLDISEVPLTIFWISFSYSLWSRGLKEKNSVSIAIAIFLMVLGSFLRSEILILSGLVYAISIPLLYFQKKYSGLIYITFGFVIPVLSFFLWNHFEYGHFLGIRYFYNYSILQNNPSGSHLYQLQKILFTSFSEPGLKVGFFLYSPYFLYVLYFYRNQFRNFNVLDTTNYHLTILILYPIIVGLSAPNDGVTITSRYVLLTIIPGIFLITNQWKNLKTKKVFLSLILFSIIINLFFLKVSKESFKMIRKTNLNYESLQSDLWIFYDTNLSGTAGLSLLTQPSISFSEFENENSRRSLFSRIKKENLKNIYIFDFSKTTPNAFMHTKRSVELNSDLFTRVLQEEGFECNTYEEKSWIGYRFCKN